MASSDTGLTAFCNCKEGDGIDCGRPAETSPFAFFFGFSPSPSSATLLVPFDFSFGGRIGGAFSSSTCIASSSSLSSASSPPSSSLEDSSDSSPATNPSHRPPPSAPSSHDHIGKLALLLVLMLRLCTFSQPSWIFLTTEGRAISRLARI